MIECWRSRTEVGSLKSVFLMASLNAAFEAGLALSCSSTVLVRAWISQWKNAPSSAAGALARLCLTSSARHFVSYFVPSDFHAQRHTGHVI